ncbi:hypothetical protein [Endozoicomonas euniceicola]|uniref:Transcriptional regulator n=1 Tax=Endozoicomonas euniceicola TaxID=1234143 RepID=A0ABY6GNI0_9GAMM|nr:hypothetical protein [Endozoicomonas euniceicola]UYM14294.1 hypothetical protein NX720_15455 [Endozoicomonas euniceicola]
MESTYQMWSTKRIANFLDASENYTRNVLIKQPDFPKPRYATIFYEGNPRKSKPRWISEEIIEWANNAYVKEEDYVKPETKRKGRPRKAVTS